MVKDVVEAARFSFRLFAGDGVVRRSQILEGELAQVFQEKPLRDSGWINSGYFALSPRVIGLDPVS
jgi:NDP-sugar pyrophosphorylase family protein